MLGAGSRVGARARGTPAALGLAAKLASADRGRLRRPRSGGFGHRRCAASGASRAREAPGVRARLRRTRRCGGPVLRAADGGLVGAARPDAGAWTLVDGAWMGGRRAVVVGVEVGVG